MGHEDKSSRPPGKIFDPQWVFVSRPCGKPSWRGGQAAVRGTESFPVAKRSHGPRRRSLHSAASQYCRCSRMIGLKACHPFGAGLHEQEKTFVLISLKTSPRLSPP